MPVCVRVCVNIDGGKKERGGGRHVHVKVNASSSHLPFHKFSDLCSCSYKACGLKRMFSFLKKYLNVKIS